MPEPARRLDGAAAADLAGLGGLALVAAIAALQAARYGIWQYGEPGAGLFPFLVAVLAAGSCVLAAAGVIAGPVPAVAAVAEEDAGPVLWRKLLIYAVTIVVWPFLLSSVGYLLSSTLAFFAILRLAERASWGTTLAVLVLSLAVSWLVFARLLDVPLPAGPFGIG